MLMGGNTLNKKILAILLLSIFLIVSVGAISAADSQDDSGLKVISVKINWDDNNQISERPNQVKVDLINDGKVVDTAILKESNAWKATFKAQNDDGTFKVSAGAINGYSVSVSGSADAGFVITSTLNEDVLGDSADDESVDAADDNSTDDVDDNSTDDESDDVADDNSTDDDTNETDYEADDINETDGDEESEDISANVTVDGLQVTSPGKTTVVKEKNEPQTAKTPKKHNVTTTTLRNTGIPIVALVCVLGVVAFVPFSRKK